MVSGKLDTVDITGIPADDLASKKLSGSGNIDLTWHGVHGGEPPSIGSMDASATVGWNAVIDRLGSAADGLSGATVGEQDGMLPAGASLSSVEVRPEGLAVDLAITPAALGNGTFGAGGSGAKGCLV